MTKAFAVLLVVHGLIHLLGAAKAFGWADLPQLRQPISPAFGALWLGSALLFVAAAAALFVSPRSWWMIGAAAILLSTIAIIPSWNDAKFGLVMNVVALAGVVFGFLAYGPFSLRAEYDRDVQRHVSPPPAETLVTEAELAPLPLPVQRYLRVTGVVGRPHVRNFRVRMHGRIRSGPRARWMPLSAEQYNVVDPPSRLFYLNAAMFAIPIQGYHRYVGSDATMRVKAAALVPVATAGGEDMAQSETVTLLNDMCLMAPAALLRSAIVWEQLDDHRVRARFTNAGHTIHAVLSFNDAGELTNFVSDDRYQTSGDGSEPRALRWSTPVAGYQSYGPVRLSSGGEARWQEPEGEYAYIELTFDEVQYNVAAAGR